MNKIKFLVPMGIMLLVACTNKETVNNTVNGPVETETQWNSRFPIVIDETTNTIDIQMDISYDACHIIEVEDDYSANWKSSLLQVSNTMQYIMDNGTLKMWSKESGESSAKMYSGNNSGSIFGTWKYNDSEHVMMIAQDSIYTTEHSGLDAVATNPVEAQIDLANSRFIYDLYICGKEEYNCYFNYQHLAKDASDLISDIIAEQDIQIHEKTERTLDLTVNGKKISVSVEHMQPDSLNNGNTFIAVSIQSQGETCRFEHAYMTVTKELCTSENVEYMGLYAYEDTNGNIIAPKYNNDNSTDFSMCVENLLN